ncbi:phage tail protein [Pseudomonas prosekii]|uniref:phage tail-collar fiber domain-containing protein n=1 Tax=Pseudomonas prosekii TaxID=1148509 RepID=UPI000D619B9A|nr:phage tail protein [Pseudomonas prosekii]PWE46183.1 phage tail protein [Pseudomonas prosekii]
MGASITLAGESLIAQKLGTQQRLEIVRFIFAHVPDLDANAPVDRAAAKPPAAQIVHSFAIPESNIGFVNPNQVVYSAMLGSDVGDFDWNWIGLESAEGVLLAVAYMPLQQKRKNIPPLQLGNNVTRNILVVFDGAQALTGITIDARTWQHDFTVRLKGIDERERLSNRDVFGRACFYGTGLQVEKVGASYQLKPGLAYVEGIRVEQVGALSIIPPELPIKVWLNVCLRRQLNDVVASWTVGFGPGQVDYREADGTWHYCIPLAQVATYGEITDLRPVEPINGPLIQHFAARIGDYAQLRARATTKEDVGLGNLPNALSDDYATNSSGVLATTKAVATARQASQQAIDKLINGTTPAGKAKQLETARQLSVSGAATGSVMFDGTANANIALTMVDNGVMPGSYAKVVINSNGLVIGNELQTPNDIPNLDWSKITSGKPTTLGGYGITDAIKVGAYGLCSNVAPYSDIDTIGLPGGFHYFSEGPTSFEQYVGLINVPYGSGSYAGQIGFQQGNIEPRVLVRSVRNDGHWTPTREVFHSGNLDPGAIVPAGAIVAFGIFGTPPGYLKANGAAVSRTTFARLFKVLDTYYGAGDGATTFNLPDLRGRFIRALDEGAGLDPGRTLGSRQDSQNAWHAHTASSGAAGTHNHPGSATFPSGGHGHTGSTTSNGSHQHGLTMGFTNLDSGNFGGGQNVYGTQYTNPAGEHTHGLNIDAAPDHSHAVGVAYDGAHAHSVTVDPSGGNESRPVNFALIYCIKY